MNYERHSGMQVSLQRGFVSYKNVDFSSFYGLLDLLSGTELNAGQNEIGENVLSFQEKRQTDQNQSKLRSSHASCY